MNQQPVLSALLGTIGLTAITFPSAYAANMDKTKPNVIILYYDDMGYGDMGANGATGATIPKDSKFLDASVPTLTPHLDKFSSGSLRFTNGHSSDGVCSPSRYSLVTGHYSWRTRLKKGVGGGYTPTFMDEDRFSVGELFRSHGYETAMVGKWHIGMSFFDAEGKPANDKKGVIDFAQPVKNTPAHRGFDYWFGTPASLDMPPYAWLESDAESGEVHVLYKGAIVDGDEVDFSQARPATNADLVHYEQNSDFFARSGIKDPTFVFQDYLQIQAQKVANLIEGYNAADKPFMIYVPMPAPHDPHAVQEKFKGSAGFTYGDYLVQTDYYTGKILDALGDADDPDSTAANTVVFISSDNGPEVGASHRSLVAGHDANGPFKGIKRDNWEGGTRVPFLIRWPGIVEPGTTDHPCWQGDFVATMADVLNYELKADEAPDAESFLPVLVGKPMPKQRRAGFIEHSHRGQFAIIDYTGEWKLLDGTGGGGNAETLDAENQVIENFGEICGAPRQLYNLKKDPGERVNLLLDPTPEILRKEQELYTLLNKIRGDDKLGSEGSSNVPRIPTKLFN
ncbi:arylsulfatase [Luteolibacter algae]|uniref:Arylsulfatase n=1 Tax=Luteolibacter algae TaxID=454151 RepID=A0ABW5D8S8_9BACT